ncbi:MAG TPA: enoyl-CoA hydratase-related protein [Aeromicrobium sp.]|nr:enoyl-CoA hydratase-related protein [Aeromicrobium sp.]HKY57434.1 enoyl-CoA hydratase-related protein [Aeromicrobium sp.]
MGEFARLEVDGGVGTIRLDRPKMNALDAQMQRELLEAAQEADARADVAAVVLYGGDRVFAAGADVKEMADMTFEVMDQHSHLLQDFTKALAAIGKPTVAAITGFALGGGLEVALTADVRFAAEDAKLGQPEILLGIIPGAGGTQRLARLVGPAKAKDLVYTGRFVEATEALAIGLVDAVHPAAEVYSKAVEWASQFVGGPALALRAAKVAIDSAHDGGVDGDLDGGLEVERREFAGLFKTHDQKAGMRSFVENGPGKATFEGR